jgi:hypothetical protein
MIGASFAPRKPPAPVMRIVVLILDLVGGSAFDVRLLMEDEKETSTWLERGDHRTPPYYILRAQLVSLASSGAHLPGHGLDFRKITRWKSLPPHDKRGGFAIVRGS